jgi:hypothetical protein
MVLEPLLVIVLGQFFEKFQALFGETPKRRFSGHYQSSDILINLDKQKMYGLAIKLCDRSPREKTM